MNLLDALRRRVMRADNESAPPSRFEVSFDPDGANFITSPELLREVRAGTAQRSIQEQYLVLDLLADAGAARPIGNGFEMTAANVARLAPDEAHVLGLPGRFAGAFTTTVTGNTTSSTFNVAVLVEHDGVTQRWERTGPVMRLRSTDDIFRLTPAQLRMLQAVEEHKALTFEQRTSDRNVRLVSELQAAQRMPALEDEDLAQLQLPLGHLDQFHTEVPEKVGLLIEPQSDGSLLVEPDLRLGLDPAELRQRWPQLDTASDDDGRGGVLRVDTTLVLLERRQLAGVREIRRTPRIPADQVDDFLRHPEAVYDPDLVDLEVDFSLRVAGLEEIVPVTFGEVSKDSTLLKEPPTTVAPPQALDGLAETLEEQAEIEAAVEEAWEHGSGIAPVKGHVVSVEPRGEVAQILARSRSELERAAALHDVGPAPDPDDDVVTVGMRIQDADDLAQEILARARDASAQSVDFDALLRTPYPHQRTGVEWMAGLMRAALDADQADPARIQGALLADDMGLGKTYMTLVALAEAFRYQREQGREPLPVLAVLPVALIENWKDEIRATFGTDKGPFNAVVTLRGDDLTRYLAGPRAAETQARRSDLGEDGLVRQDRLARLKHLRTGDDVDSASRLDRPGTLVLVTYETLRRYQVSLGTGDWGIVVMDEAQTTKNPETLVTRAAKGIRARFKLLATGTPVENTLRDFWCLLDTAQPGLLGSWSEFRQRWVVPIRDATGDIQRQLGAELRAAVGPLMLRRTKDDVLTDLPPKTFHDLPHEMPAVQQKVYDDVLAAHEVRKGRKGAALEAIGRLQRASLHPHLVTGTAFGSTDHDASARTFVTISQTLERICSLDEKVIVFTSSKKIQRALAEWIRDRFGFVPSVVNGDTPATGDGDSRLAKIRAFESTAGFNVIVMSPLAVGVGLTVTEANHVIHLERHWNPAKEAQATDRVYRIGQEREVHVYHPMAIHPTLTSFDVHLDELLRNKVALKDAVVVPEEVTYAELKAALRLL